MIWKHLFVISGGVCTAGILTCFVLDINCDCEALCDSLSVKDAINKNWSGLFRGHVKVTALRDSCAGCLMSRADLPPNVCSIKKTYLTPDCFCSWVEVVLKGLALWERDTHRQTDREREMFCVIPALKPLVLELDSVSQRDFSSQSYMTVKVDWWQRRRAFLMSLFLKEVRENSNIEQNDRNWTVWLLKHYSNIYWFNSILTQH